MNYDLQFLLKYIIFEFYMKSGLYWPNMNEYSVCW